MRELRICPTCSNVFRARHGSCPKDGAALLALDRDPLVGATFAERYVIESCLGVGGMGLVYAARHVRMSRRFAVKVMFGEDAINLALRERFQHEAELASRLSHPNIVSVVDFGETKNGLAYLVMDFIEGETLVELIKRTGGLPVDRSTRIARQLGLALAHAHQRGVIHRDLKPANVMIVDDGAHGLAKVVDFGVAKLRPDLASVGPHTGTGIVIGTPAYMAPEQAVCTGVDHRIDLFSLGLVFYEMLAGKGPFDGDPLAILRQNMSAMPPLIAERRPGMCIPHEVEWVVHKLLAKDRAERFESAEAFVAELDRAMSPGPPPNDTTIDPTTVSKVTFSGSRARKSLVALALAGAVGGVLGAQLSSWSTEEPAPVISAAIVEPPPRAPTVVAGEMEIQATPKTVEVRKATPKKKSRVVKAVPSKPERPTRVEPEPAIQTAPPASPREPDPAQLAKLNEVERTRASKRISIDDIPGFAMELHQARDAIKDARTDDANAALDRLQALLDKTRVDADFVHRKLERLSRLAKDKPLDAPHRHEVSDIFGRVHLAYFAGDFEKANAHLAAIQDVLNHGR
jgi:serine/threonine protein kinase